MIYLLTKEEKDVTRDDKIEEEKSNNENNEEKDDLEGETEDGE